MNKKCNDVNCPEHGNLKIRGKLIAGEVVRKKSSKTIHVQKTEYRFIPKYERYLKVKHTFAVHCPECKDIKVGDRVLCGETKKLSKTKSYVVIKKLDSENEKSKINKNTKKKVNITKPKKGEEQ